MLAPTSSLESLPNEILLVIVNIFDAGSDFPQYRSCIYPKWLSERSLFFVGRVPYVVEPYLYAVLRRRAAIHNLALVSKHLNDIATPILYTTFAHPKRRSLMAFFKQLLARPILRRCVKKILCTSVVLEDHELEVTALTESECESCSRVFVENNLGMGDMVLNWRRDIEEGNWDAILALLLCQTPALQKLTLFRHGKHDTRYLQGILYSAGERLLPSLRSVSLHYWDHQGSFKLRNIMPFLCLKSLEDFYVDRLAMETNTVDEDFDGEDFPPADAITLSNQTFNAKGLCLDRCNIDADKLIVFLGCFKSLQQLHYCHDKLDVEFAEFHPRKLGVAIAHLTDHLRLLDVASISILSDGFQDYEDTSIGTLCNFKFLQDIRVECHILLGFAREKPTNERSLVSYLPKSLKRLMIVEFTAESLRHIPYLLEHKEQSVPRLEAIDLGLPSPNKAFEHKLLRNNCMALGVNFNILWFDPCSESDVDEAVY